MITALEKGEDDLDENRIIPYIEPIFRFCCKRLSNRCDAEDLTGEILCHILDGIKKYKIESLDAWVWRIAHNRYARFIDVQKKNHILLAEEDMFFDVSDGDYFHVDVEATRHEFEAVFRCLHTLSSCLLYTSPSVRKSSSQDLSPVRRLPVCLRWCAI